MKILLVSQFADSSAASTSSSAPAASSSSSTWNAPLVSLLTSFTSTSGSSLTRCTYNDAATLVQKAASKSLLSTAHPYNVVVLEYDQTTADLEDGHQQQTQQSGAAAASSSATAMDASSSVSSSSSTNTGLTASWLQSLLKKRSAHQIPPFFTLLGSLNSSSPTSLLIVLTRDTQAIEQPQWRWNIFQYNAHMCTSLLTLGHLQEALDIVKRLEEMKTKKAKGTKTYTCEFCTTTDLVEDAFHLHNTIFHANHYQSNKYHTCPICNTQQKRYFVHVHNQHGPQGRGEVPSENIIPNTLYPYSMVIVRRPKDGKFLVVQEFSNSGYWFPGGRAENGESMEEAAHRECLEEAGVSIKLTGIARIEYSSYPTPTDGSGQAGYTRFRVFFVAEPISEYCKTLPDYESVGAAWVTIEELRSLHLRSDECIKWFQYIVDGGVVHPLSVLKNCAD